MNKFRLPRLAAVNSQNNESALSTDNVGVEVTLENGKHTIEIDGENLFDLLQLPEIEGKAGASVQYEYLEDINAIKLASAHYTGESANKLVIDKGSNLSAPQHKRLGAILDNFTNRLIEVARAAGLRVLERWDMPKLPDGLEDELKYVYRNGKLIGPYVGEECDGDEVVSLGSVFGGIEIVISGPPQPIPIWNAIGSTGDKNPYGASWVGFWALVAQTYDHVNGSSFYGDFAEHGCVANGHWGQCNNTSLYGGHVVSSPAHIFAPYGISSVVVGIMPICARHNAYQTRNISINTQTGETSSPDAADFAYPVMRPSLRIWLDAYHENLPLY